MNLASHGLNLKINIIKDTDKHGKKDYCREERKYGNTLKEDIQANRVVFIQLL